MTISRSNMYKQLEKGNKKMMRKKGGSIRRMKKGGPTMTIAKLRAAAKKKGYKLVKA